MKLIPFDSTQSIKNQIITNQNLQISVAFEHVNSFLNINFLIHGSVEAYKLLESFPADLKKEWSTELYNQKEDLWKSTCFEFFLKKQNSSSYIELNLSPLGFWNMYRFSDYRKDMTKAKKAPPFKVTMEKSSSSFRFSFPLSLQFIQKALDEPQLVWSQLEFKPTLVLEEVSGIHSYWAALHLQEKPDFHDLNAFSPYHTSSFLHTPFDKLNVRK